MHKGGRAKWALHFRRSAGAYLALIAILVITTLVAYVARHTGQDHEQQDFHEAARGIARAIEERMEAYVDALHGTRALIQASFNVTRQEFKTYIKSIDLRKRYPGMQGVGFVRRLRQDQIVGFAERVGRELAINPCGYPDLTIFPEGVRTEYYVVDFIEPIQTNQQYFGQDILLEPSCREPMQQARDNGALTLTKRIDYQQGERVRPGFALLLPLYRGGKVPGDVAQRRAALSGFVLGYFITEDLFSGIFGNRPLSLIDMDFEVFDGPSPNESRLMYDNDKQLHALGDTDESRLYLLTRTQLGGRTWSLFFSAKPAFHNGILRYTPHFIFGGGLVFGLLMFRSMQSRKTYLMEKTNQASALTYQATHDALTGLVNRNQLFENFRRVIASNSNSARHMALLLIDLDGFKEINDTLGHHNGDLLLQQIGPRIEKLLRPTDTLARLGGDEFALLIEPLHDRQESFRQAYQLLSAIRQPFELEGISVQIDASIGVAFYPDHGRDSSTLMRCADIAMYIAKRNKSGYEVYDPSLDQYTPRRLSLMSDLRHALDVEELVLYYQPKINIKTRQLVGLEALIRWQHPKEGLIPPADFIPQVEASALIRPLTLYVMDKAIAQCRQWRDQGLETTIAINISARNLLDTKLPARAIELLSKHDVPADCLEMEITESAIIVDPERAFQILALLHRAGIRLSIDDFGTGYSSLAHLKKLPVSTLKIDTSFVNDMHVDDNDAVIVHSTVNLAHNLGMRVVAEGVESQDILDILDIIDCDYAQGYYICRPQPADAIMDWLKQTNRLTRAGRN